LLSTELITDEGGLGDLYAAWDDLAVLSSAPMAAPAWTLSWLRHLSPRGRLLRIIAVREGDGLVGIVPLFAKEDRGTIAYTTLGERMLWRVTPLSQPGRAWEVAEAAWKVLLEADPAPDIVRFRSSSLGDWYAPWHLAAAGLPWRERPVISHGDLNPCPFTATEGDFDAWFAGRSSNFRGEMRRARRKLEQAGGTIRTSSPETIEADLHTYVRLHLARWEDRGSGFEQYGQALPRMLVDVARELPAERLVLHMVELDGEPAGAQLFTQAGEVLSFHNSGWNPEHAKLKPGLVGMLHTVEQAFGGSVGRLDYGPGDYSYKLRFATGMEPVVRSTFLFPGPRLARAAASRLVSRARRGS
jgi:CelD/BcsL family acetyltransferase involved in cellulose biosynthesis